MQQILGGQVVGSNLSASATLYFPLVGGTTGATATATELNGTQPWPTAGTLSNLVIRLDTAPAAGKSWAFTVRINGSDTLLACTIADTALTNRDITHSVSIAAGDRVTVRAVPTGTPTLPGIGGTRLSVEFTSTTTAESVLTHGVSPTITAAAGTRYAPVLEGGDWYTTAAEATDVVPLAGTLTALYLLPNGAIGAANSQTCTLWLNGVKQDGSGGTPNTTVALTVGMTAASGTFSLAVVAGDQLYLEDVKVGTNSTRLGFAVRVVATTDGQSIVAGGTNGAMATTGTRYNNAGWVEQAWTTTEAPAALDGGVTSFGLSQVYLLLSGTPGSGKSYTFDLRVNAASPGGTPSVTVADAATTGSDTTGSVTVADTNTWDLRVIPSGTPTARWARWAAVQGPVIAPATSTGSITFATPALAGTGSATVAAVTSTGSETFGTPALAGTGTAAPLAATSSGSVTFGKPALAATGAQAEPVVVLTMTRPTCAIATAQLITLTGTDFPATPVVTLTDPNGLTFTPTILTASSTVITFAAVFAVCGTWTVTVSGSNVLRIATIHRFTTRRLRQFRLPASPDRAWVFCRSLEILLQAGVGNTVAPGDDPQLMLTLSRDGGLTWSPERTVSAGKIGAYTRRARFRNLGRYRMGGVARLVVTDPVPWAWLRASAALEEGTR